MICIRIGGIIDISTKDIPGKASMVIFTVGCNFKCEFCHNKYLLFNSVGKDILIKDLIKNIESNQLVGSVSITGGEPTLQEDLIGLCKEISKLDKFISVDTNGSNPEIIKNLIPYVNRIALDFKTNPLDNKRYEEISRVKLGSTKVLESFTILNKSEKIQFEIRTTYVENLMIPRDIHEIICFLKEQKFKGTYVLQQYQFSEGVGDELKDKFEKPLHSTLLEILKPYKDQDLGFKVYLRSDVVGYKPIEELYKN
ncbi:MAG: anaerobic ribonucleoside-triphosphate reductase activating protein [Promethearchaeota archaeon]